MHELQRFGKPLRRVSILKSNYFRAFGRFSPEWVRIKMHQNGHTSTEINS